MYKYKWYILYNYNSCISVQKITGALASLCKKITYTLYTSATKQRLLPWISE